VDCGHQAQGDFGQIGRLEEAFEKSDRLGKTGSARGAGFGQIEQREAVGDFAEGLERPVEAVAVGIGLDHGEGLGVAGPVFGEKIVVTQASRSIEARIGRGMVRVSVSFRRQTRDFLGYEIGKGAHQTRAEFVLSTG
jgi:hypothetical protein